MTEPVELAGIIWPGELLERTPTTDLQSLATTFDPTGTCLACEDELGPPLWAAVVDAAAGPFGAWIARGRLAHPACLTSEMHTWNSEGPRTFSASSDKIQAGFQPFPIPADPEGWEGGPTPAGELNPFPTIIVHPTVDAFLIGTDPASTRVENKTLGQYHAWGWHRLRKATIVGKSVDFSPPEAAATLMGHTLVIGLPDGAAWEVDLPPELADAIDQIGCVATIIGAHSLEDAEANLTNHLYPGPLYGMLWLSGA